MSYPMLPKNALRKRVEMSIEEHESVDLLSSPGKGSVRRSRWDAQEDNDVLDKRGKPRYRFQPVPGAKVDFFSERLGFWVPASITNVDLETGFLQVDFAPGQQFPPPMFDPKRGGIQDALEEDESGGSCFRPRTRPRGEQLATARAMLRDLSKARHEAVKIFRVHAWEETEAGRAAEGYQKQTFWTGVVVTEDRIIPLGAALDKFFGVSGATLLVKRVYSECREQGRKFDHNKFLTLVYELAVKVISEYSDSLLVSRCPDQKIDKNTFQKLGAGGFGAIFKAQDKFSGEDRAVKMIKRSRTRAAAQANFVPDGQDVIEAWNAVPGEVQMLRLMDHPHIVKLYEHYFDDDYHYMVMDFVCSGDLANLIVNGCTGPLPPRMTGVILRQTLLALEHAHAHGVVHLDIKEKNILVGRGPPVMSDSGPTVHTDPHVMLIDFGVSQYFRPGDYRDHVRAGTINTMAPEVLHKTVTSKADVFGLGCVLYSMCTKHKPFPYYDRESMERFWSTTQTLDLRRMKLCRAPESFQKLCSKMVTQNMQDRPTAAMCLRDFVFHEFLEDDVAAWFSACLEDRSRSRRRIDKLDRLPVIWTDTSDEASAQPSDPMASTIAGLRGNGHTSWTYSKNQMTPQERWSMYSRALKGKMDPVPALQTCVDLMLKMPERNLLWRSLSLTIVRTRSKWTLRNWDTFRRLFNAVDVTGTGHVNKEEVALALQAVREVSPNLAMLAADAMDFSRDGTIAWSEFLASCIDITCPLYAQVCALLFDQADKDKDGLIDQEELASMLLTKEFAIDSSSVHEVLPDIAGEADPKAKFTWQEFINHLRGIPTTRKPKVASPVPPPAPPPKPMTPQPQASIADCTIS